MGKIAQHREGPSDPEKDAAILPTVAGRAAPDIALPTDCGELYWAMRTLACYATRDDPAYHEIHQGYELLVRMRESDNQEGALPSEDIERFHLFLTRRIQNLESSLNCIIEELGAPTSLTQPPPVTFMERVKFLQKAAEESFVLRALEIFEPPSIYTSAKQLPPTLEMLVRSTASELLNLERPRHGFKRVAFDMWFREVAAVWEREIYPNCIQIVGDGSEYMFKSVPSWEYCAELEESEPSLGSFYPPDKAHGHLRFLHSATRVLDLITTDVATTRAMLGPQFKSFLKGDALICPLVKSEKYEPSLTLRQASHEGAPGIEIAIHPDRPRHRYDAALGKISVRFLTPEQPLIVACQGVSARTVIERAWAFKHATVSQFTKDLRELDTITLNDAPSFFKEQRKEVCQSIGTRTAIDAALLSTIIVLRELGFKSVLGISDVDQHAMLDQSESTGKQSTFYDSLFQACGFTPPRAAHSRFWSLSLDANSFWIDSRVKLLPDELSYYAIVLSRDPLKTAKRDLNGDSPLKTITKDQKLFQTFCDVLLPKARALAEAIATQKAFTALSHQDF